MPSLPRISIARMMCIIALFAVEMAAFQRVLVIVLVPPVTMALVSVNLMVFYGLRWLPRSMEARIFGMVWGGMVSIFVLVGYYLTSRGALLGVGGRLISDFLANLAASQADPSGPGATILRFGVHWVLPAEIVLLDLLGLAMIWASGWVFSRRFGATTAQAGHQPESASPLDDRAVTPL